MIDQYDWAGGREAMIRLGPDTGPVVILALPLFEEANRTRTFAVTLMRMLAGRGVASVLPDLPGTGESVVATQDATLAHWRAAFAVAARGAIGSITIRSGALVDTEAAVAGRWQLSPQDGPSLIRELERIRGDGATIGGNRISAGLLADLATAEPVAARVVRLADDPRPADRKVMAAPLWRRAEPGDDPTLATELADDIADWVRTCAA